MSAQRQNAGDLSGDLFRAIEQARHLKTGTAFKNYFVDQQLFRGELSRDPRVQRSFFRKRTETFRQPLPDILPVGFGIGFGPDIVQTVLCVPQPSNGIVSNSNPESYCFDGRPCQPYHSLFRRMPDTQPVCRQISVMSLFFSSLCRVDNAITIPHCHLKYKCLLPVTRRLPPRRNRGHGSSLFRDSETTRRVPAGGCGTILCRPDSPEFSWFEVLSPLQNVKAQGVHLPCR